MTIPTPEDRPAAIPGTARMEDREFLYVQAPAGEKFRRFFGRMWKIGSHPLPKTGGVINEECVISTPDQVTLHGVSYRGDVAGWRIKALDCMHELGLLHGHIDGRSFVLSNGKRHDLEECVVTIDGVIVK